MTNTEAPAATPAVCRCGDALALHIDGKPCVFGERRTAPTRLHHLPIFGRMWAQGDEDDDVDPIDAHDAAAGNLTPGAEY